MNIKNPSKVKDTIIIIPALNEEKSIALVLNDLPLTRIIKTIVVDNGSTDQTAQIAEDSGAFVISEKKRGYGQACLTGIEEALKDNPLNIVFLDGDYSDHPNELPLLLDELDKGVELVIGSRMLGKAEKGALLIQGRLGNMLATFLMKLLFGGKKFSDLGPFRGIKTSSLKKIAMKDTNFGWTIEMQLKAIIFDLKISEVSLSYRKRVGVSKITGTIMGTIKAGYKILYTIAKYKIEELKKS